MKLSVIMASFLGEYPNCASNRIQKFYRALDSFMWLHDERTMELIVVSDGCIQTQSCVEVFLKERFEFGTSKSIRVINLPGGQHFSGAVRQEGIKQAKGDIIAYLDTDDFVFNTHLFDIINAFEKYPNADWVYFNDFVTLDGKMQYRQRDNIVQQGRIGTSSIAHRRSVDVQWPDGYGHDWHFIKQLQQKYPVYEKVTCNGYMVCHIPGQVDK